MGDPVYLDTSALVKLVLQEDQSDALRQFLDETSSQPATSEIAEVELLRAIARHDDQLTKRGLEILTQLVLLPLTTSMRLRASYLAPSTMRSLDALHVATALEIQSDLECLVSYDERMLRSASDAGIKVVSPGISLSGI
jgi:predicted nucleic acid-binding protein